MDLNYSLLNLSKKFKENKPLIEAYFKGQPVEGFNDNSNEGTIMGLGIVAFLVLFIFGLSIWIWAIISLVKYWKVLPDWAKIIGLLALLPVLPIGGPIVTLIIVYVAKPKESTNAYKFRFY